MLREHGIKVFDSQRLAALYVDELLRQQDDSAMRASESDLHLSLKKLAEALPQIEDIWVLAADSKPLVSAYTFPVPRDADLNHREYFRVHRDGRLAPGQPYVSEILTGQVRGGVFFAFSIAHRTANGELRAVSTISVDPKEFERFYQAFTDTEFSTVALVRDDGSVLARIPGEIDNLPNLPKASALIEQTQKSSAAGVYEGWSRIDGVERVVAYQRLPKDPVYVAIGKDRSAVVAAWRAEVLGWLWFAVPGTLALFGLSLLALHFIRKEELALANLKEAIARREESEQRVRQMQKMEAVGQLTGGIAHDFNNLLTIILGSLQMMRRKKERGEPGVERYLDAATEGAERAAALTARLLAFARLQPLEPKPVDANKLLSGMSELLRRAIGDHIMVEAVLAGGLWETNVDANQLENALLNLAVNARDAMPKGGKLTLETANAHLDDQYASGHSEVLPGQYIAICVTDTGHGMSPEIVATAFDPFFTTKKNGKGTGLGLSQVYGFVKQSGGHVKIYSEIGHGTTVKIYLPRHIGNGKRETASDAPQGPILGSETILVVEDEDQVRQFTREALEDLGYTVLDAPSGSEALNILDQQPQIDLLFTDIVMPGMNGKELADKALRRLPHLKVLYTTGYSRNAIVHNGVLDPGVALINKPFTISQVGAKVRQVLDNGSRLDGPSAQR